MTKTRTPKARPQRRPRQATRPTRTERRLPDQYLHLTDRCECAWQDHQFTWRGTLQADTNVFGAAPAGFHVMAVLQPDAPYLWMGIAAPDTHAARICFATISGDTLRRLAIDILRYVPAEKDGAR